MLARALDQNRAIEQTGESDGDHVRLGVCAASMHHHGAAPAHHSSSTAPLRSVYRRIAIRADHQQLWPFLGLGKPQDAFDAYGRVHRKISAI